MKVRVRLTRWNAGSAVNGAVAHKLVEEVLPEPNHWQHPPRYEVRPAASSPRDEKVIPIRQEPVVQRAEVQPIREDSGRTVNSDKFTPEELVQGVTHVLNPASAFFLALGLWRLGSDLGLTSAFVVSEGLLSHWQVWIAAAGALQALGFALRKRFAACPDTPRAAD